MELSFPYQRKRKNVYIFELIAVAYYCRVIFIKFYGASVCNDDTIYILSRFPPDEYPWNSMTGMNV